VSRKLVLEFVFSAISSTGLGKPFFRSQIEMFFLLIVSPHVRADGAAAGAAAAAVVAAAAAAAESEGVKVIAAAVTAVETQ
jgi:hypothetical protein